MTRSVSLFVATMWERFSKHCTFSPRSSFVWLLCLELAWRAGPLRIREVIVTFLTLAKAAACNKALHAVHFTMSLPSWGIFQWQSANPCLNLTLGSNLGELCWLFQKMEMSLSEKLGSREDLIFHCWKLNIVGSFLSLKSAAYAMAKRPQLFPPFCCSTSATSIMMLLGLGDIDSHTAFCILQSYRIVLCLFMFKACELSYTIAASAAVRTTFDTQTQCCGRWILWINFERFYCAYSMNLCQ